MRHKINDICNVVTGEHATTYIRQDGSNRPQITVPHLRLRLDVQEAERLHHALVDAIQFIKLNGS